MEYFIKEIVIDQVEIHDLDVNVPYLLSKKDPTMNGDDDYYEYIEDENFHGYWNEGEFIPVEMLEKTIKEMKAKGADHFRIYPRGDHKSYYITGVKLELLDNKKCENVIHQKQKAYLDMQKQVLTNENEQVKRRIVLIEEYERILTKRESDNLTEVELEYLEKYQN